MKKYPFLHMLVVHIKLDIRKTIVSQYSRAFVHFHKLSWTKTQIHHRHRSRDGPPSLNHDLSYHVVHRC